MKLPDDRRYHPDHLWAQVITSGQVRVGITDYAQDKLGKVVYIDLPEVGQAVTAGQDMGAIESAKSVSDLIAPINGRVAAINDALNDEPGAVNDDPYGEGWIAVIFTESMDQLEDLLTAPAYLAGLG